MRVGVCAAALQMVSDVAIVRAFAGVVAVVITCRSFEFVLFLSQA